MLTFADVADQHVSSGLSRLAQTMRAGKEHILAAWARAVRARGVVDGKQMDQPSLIDSIPDLLDVIIAKAEAAAAGKVPPVPADESAEHALERLSHGYDLTEVMTEYALLREAIVQHCARTAPEVGPLELQVAHAAVDEAVTIVADTFATLRERTLGALDRISTTALATPELDELLQKLAEVLVGSSPAIDSVQLLLLDGDQLRVRATYGLGAADLRGFTLAVGEGFGGTIAANRKPMLLRASDFGAFIRSDVLRASGTKVLYGMPLEHGGRVLGVAHMGSRTASEFSQEDLLLFHSLTERAASAIANAELLTRDRVSFAVAKVLAEASSLDEAMPGLLQAVGETCGWKVGASWVFDAESQRLRHHKSWTAQSFSVPAFEELSRSTTFRAGEGMPGRTLQAMAPTWIPDVTVDSTFLRISAATAEGLHSAVALPLISEGRVVAIVEFFSDRIRSPAESLVQLTRMLSQKLGNFMRRIDAQEHLRRSESQKTAMLNASLDSVVSMDADGRVIEWNPAAERAFGYSREEAVGRDMADLIIPPRLRDAHRRGLARFLATGQQRYFGRRLAMPALRRDGTEFSSELVITSSRAGGVARFTGFIRDLTEQRAAAAAQSQSEERLRLALEAGNMGAWEYDPITGRIQWDERTKSFFGLPLDAEVTYDTWLQLVHPEDRDQAHAQVQAALQGATGGSYDVAFRVASDRDEDERWIRATGRVYFQDGAAVRFVGTVRDISELKKVQEKLERSELQFRTAIEAMPQMVWTAGADGQLDYLNPRLAQYLGPRAGAFLSGAWDQVIHPDDLHAFESVWSRAIAAHEPFQVERRLRRSDGVYRWFLTRAVAIRDERGRTRKWLGTSTDIDDLKRAETELRKRAEFEQQLIGIVSHDIRNPLNAILLSAHTLQRAEGLNEQQGRAVARMRTAAERAARLARDLLDFTRARVGGGIPLEAKPLDFHATVRKVLDEVQVAHPERSVQFRAHGDGAGVFDGDRLAQIVTNLLSNALAYSTEGTPVRVETFGEESEMLLTVHNEGAPIQPELLPVLFEPMRRGTDQGAARGSVGLGLYIVDQIVRAHGGAVSVTSSAEQGTKFTVRIPRSPLHAFPGLDRGFRR